MLNQIYLLIAVLNPHPTDSGGQLAASLPQSFSFPVTGAASESVRRSRHFLRGGVGFGEWCVETCGDFPWVPYDGRFNSVLGSGPAGVAGLLREILDKATARDVLRRYPNAVPTPITNLPAAVAYLYATARLDGLDPDVPENGYSSARSYLQSFVASRGRKALGSQVAIATILLANMTSDESQRVDLLKLVDERSEGDVEPFGLSAAVRESMDFAANGGKDLAESLAARALTKYRRLAAWRNYEILKVMVVDPVRAVKTYGPLG